MFVKVRIKKSDRPLAALAEIASKIETFDGGKLGSSLILVGTGIMFLSTDTARGMAIKVTNSVYDKFRKSYGISDEAFILVKRKNIEIILDK